MFPMTDKVRIVVATRMSHENFMTQSATGRTLRMTRHRNIELIVTSNNREGLPKVYNQVIRHSAQDPATLVFVHDDLHFTDFHWCSHLFDGLERFDVVGVAGNVRRVPGQVSWPFVDRQFTWDDKQNLSGAVAHGKQFPPDMLSRFGESRRQVKLLDGLFLAARSETLLSHGIEFDEAFDFHLYDMDFCRQVEQKGLRCGTWDIALIHESPGGFNTEPWRAAADRYLKKWGE